jgi:DNA-binding MarR family transcriptional regulator
VDSYVHRFYAAHQELRRDVETKILQKLDSTITGPQIYMLHYISQRGKCKLTELADKLEVKPSAVTVMIDRLEKAGFVTRIHDTVDRRAILVEVTASGKEVLNRAVGQRNEIISSYLSNLEPEEVELVTELLEKMILKK